MAHLAAPPARHARPPHGARGAAAAHLPPPAVPRQGRLQGAVQVLLHGGEAGAGHRRGPGPVARGGLPQPPLRHHLQQLRRAQGAVPGPPGQRRQRRREAPREAGGRDPRRRGRGRRQGHARRGGEDGAGQVRGVGVAAPGPARQVPVRPRQEGPADREPRRRVPGEEGRDAVRLPAVRHQGPARVRRHGQGVRARPVRRRGRQQAAAVRVLVQRTRDREPQRRQQAVPRQELCGARRQALPRRALPPLRHLHRRGRHGAARRQCRLHRRHQSYLRCGQRVDHRPARRHWLDIWRVPFPIYIFRLFFSPSLVIRFLSLSLSLLFTCGFVMHVGMLHKLLQTKSYLFTKKSTPQAATLF